MKSKKDLKFNKSSIRLLIELLLITVSIFVLTNTSGANYVFNSLFANAEGEEVTVDGAENVMGTASGFEVDTATNTCTITSNVGLVQYSILYQTNPAAYQNVNIKIAISEGDLSNLPEFKSFGDVNYPFNANIIVAQSTDFSVTLDVPLFSYIYDSSRICDSTDNDKIVSIIKASDASASTPLFAENVVKNNENKTPAKWIIGVGDCQDKCSGIIGTIGAGAEVDITVTATGSSINITNNNNAGFICQTMEDGSSLTVNMPQAIAYNVTSASGYAGGLVGYATNAEINISGSVSISGTINGVLGAGGVFGYYESNQGGSYDLSNYNINCTLAAANPDAATTGNSNSGGVFGVLKNNKKADGTCSEMIITNVGTDNIKPIINSSGNCNCGGLIGNYSSNDVGNSITVSGAALNVSLNNASTDTTTYYGGIIGMIDDDSYVKFENNVSVTAANCSGGTTVFGGLVGCVDKAFIEAGDVIINAGEFTGGGVVGEMNGGVLRLSGTTDLSAAKAVGGGQIVGTRGDQALIYAADGWKLIRSSAQAEYDDIGTWGEVLRFNSSTFTEDSVLNKGSDGHTVTVTAASTTVNTLADFAKLALNIQMNDGTVSASALVFADTANSTSAKLLGANITLNCDIDLSGTGITGLTRDDGTNAPFTGKFVGNSHTIKLATGELYGYRGNGSTLVTAAEDGNGNIHRHLYSGLFAKTSDGAEFNGLTVSGNITVKYKNDLDIYCIGGLSALHVNDNNNSINENKFTAENITVTETIDHSGNGGTYHFVGGMVGGFDQFSNAYITLTNCTFKPYINDTSSNSKLLCAGAIGEIRESRNVVITATGITLSSQSVEVDGTKNNITNKSTATEKRVGGFISNIANFNGTAGTRTMRLEKITIDGASVTSTSANGGIGGALLGESWNNMNVTIGGNGVSGITVKNSTVTYNGNGNFAGLVTIATGYWQVHSIDIQSGNVISGSNAKSFGMLINKGKYNDNSKTFALYLELLNKDAYKLDSSVSISIGNATVFDEIVATCHGNYDNSADNIMKNNVCAIVSIHTDGDIVTMNGTDRNTYQNQTGRTTANPNTRYYYNLDVLRAKSETALTAPEKLMLWSINVYAYYNLKDYFYNAFTDNVIPAGEYNMTGYSYYPVDISSGITIENGCSFTFANDKIIADTVSSTSQHYLMHCGLFRNVNSDMTVSNVSFAGSVGQGSCCGALVCGTIWGSDAQHIATAAIDGVTLDGIAVNGNLDNYAPLLINKIGSNTSFSLNNVRTTEKYASDSIAASSLIGDVGGDTADNIQLSFSGIVLDGRNKTGVLSALDDAYNTTRSIFNRATLLNSFKYPSGKVCNAVYNYKIGEDWEEPLHQVTYGKEVSHSAEYTGEGKQKWYVDSSYYTSPESAQAESEYNFSTDFLPYVYIQYDADNTNNIAHEIKVNHQGAAKLDEGCGTYNDPYIIRTPAQLLLVAEILNNSPEDGVAINYTDNTVNNYKTWCEDKTAHTLFTYSSSESAYVSEDDTVSVSKDTIKQAVSTAYYMLAEDIEISEELAKEKNFQGIGYSEPFKGVIYGADHKITNESTSPLIYQSVGVVIKDLTVEVTADFSNVLIESAGSKYYTDGGSAAFYGGLIGIVNGGDNIIDKVSVTITNAGTINIAQNSYYGNKAVGGYIGVVRYGGVIFRNMGEVEHAGITDDKNSSFKSTGDFKNNDSKVLLYCNPIIGRVIDGFAVTESDAFRADENSVTMKNGTKNYSIADIKKDSTDKIGFSNMDAIKDNRSWEAYISTITVPDSQSLFLLGCITMSGAGKVDVTHNVYWDKASNNTFEPTGYGKKNADGNTYQMVRHGDYDGTPDDFNDNVKYFDKFSRDGTYTDKFSDNKDTDRNKIQEVVPYLIYKYTTEKVTVSGDNKSGEIFYPARTLTSNGSVFKIELAENGQYVLPDGFRGIGSLNTSKDNSQMYIYSLKGNGSTIKLNMNFYKYRNGYDKYYTCNDWQKNYVGLGLFNTLIQNKRDILPNGKNINNVYSDFPDYKVSDMTITGIVNMVSYHDEKAAINYDDKMCCAGGLAGAFSSNEGSTQHFAACIDNVDLINLAVNSSHIAGGLTGFVKGQSDSNLSKVKINNCSAVNVSVNSGYYAGGLVGLIKQCEFSIDGTAETNGKSSFNNIQVYTTKDYTNNNIIDQLGIGGMIGTILTKCTLTIKNINIANSVVNSDGGLLALGSVVGYSYNNTSVQLENVNVTNVDIHKDKEKSKIYCGGLIGRVYMDSSDKTVALENCHVEGSGSNIIYGSAQGNSNVGGLVGWIYGNAAATANVNNCSVDNYVIRSTSTTDNCGGFIGKSEVIVSLTNSKISNCTVQGVAGEPVGGIIGYCSDGGINGYNIVSDKVHITDPNGQGLASSSDSDKDGDIAGRLASGKTINLVGVCVYKGGEDLYSDVSIGKKEGTGYIIYSDYSGACIDEMSANKTASNIIEYTNNISTMGSLPYATVNPKVKIGIEAEPKFLTSDGAYNGAAANIIAGIDNINGYKNISDDADVFDTSYKDKLSTFNEKTGAGVSNNFPVLVINDSNPQNITDMLNSYIHILTNDSSISNYASDGGSKYNVEIIPLRLNSTSNIFETQSSFAKTLKSNNTYFKMTDEDYDSNHSQFSLIDIQYYDPTTTDDPQIVYHLYIPVYVEKMLKFNFTVGALSGTTYNTQNYINGKPVMENYGTPITAHITYSYLRTVQEWERAINSGENLLQGYGKSVVLKQMDNLAGDTRLVLVDKNNSDKAYYSTMGEAFDTDTNKLVFSKFFTSGDNSTAFQPVSFMDLLSRSAEISMESNSDGTLVKCGEDDISLATIKISNNGNVEYYRKRTETDNDTSNLFSAKVTAKNSTVDPSSILAVDEEYYITFFTIAKDEDKMSNITLTCDSRLEDSGMIPSRMNNDDKNDPNNERLIHMIIGNLFVQSFSFQTTNTSQLITEANKTITANLLTEIKWKDENQKADMQSYLKNPSIHLYHSFIVEATTTDGEVSEKGVKGNPQVSGTYKVGENTYNISINNNDSIIKIGNDGNGGVVDIKDILITNDTVTIMCDDLHIEYADDASIIAQFPQRKNTTDTTTGVKYSASSNLAYVADNIEHSNISEGMTDEYNKSYYRENISSASLSYNIPAVSANDLTALGINGRESNDKINAVAYYNVQNIPEADLNKAAYVKFTLSLYQKDNDGNYNQVDVGTYLEEVRLYYEGSGENNTGYASPDGADSYTFTLEKYKLNLTDGLYEVKTSFDVKTGAEFENGNLTYANYKVVLTAELLDDTKTSIDNSSCSDHIIYTNAKICTDMLAA